MQGVVWGGRHQLDVVDRDTDEVEGSAEAEAKGSETGLRRCLRHEGAHRIVGQEQAVEFLDHAGGFAATSGVSSETLRGVDLVDSEFDFPPCMISDDEIVCRCGVGVEQRGHETMGFAVAGAGGVGEGVDDDTDEEMSATLAALTGGRIDKGPVRVVR